jgi:putative ABC transport system permease protein
MFHFIIAWRNLLKNRVSSLINIVSLSTGMMCFIIILLYVENELSYDTGFTNANRIYRVVKDFVNNDGSVIPDATTPPALAPALRADMPEVAYVTRLFPGWGRKYLIQHEDKGFYETDLIRIDSNFFNVFNFPFISGDKNNTFKNPQSIILTQTSAKKYFGNANPVGQTVKINVNNGQSFVVTGVIKDVPENAHFTFNFLIPFVSTRDSVINKDWNFYSFYTYVMLKQNASASSFIQKLQPLFSKYQPLSKNRYYTQRLTDIHLTSNLKWELGVNNDILYIKILIAIAILVIVIAAINYINLVTARAVKRAREVGIRKVSGASKQLLVVQFLTESVCTAFASFAFSLIAVSFILPFVNRLLNHNLSLFTAGQWVLWLQLIAVTMFIGIAAGLYPAFHLSSFQPVKVLKGKFISSAKGGYLRKGLVVFQFAISIVLIVSFFTIYHQVEFVTQKNLGFNKYNILLLPNVRGTGVNTAVPAGNWLDEIKKMPAVKSIARADGILGGLNSTSGVGTSSTHISLNFMRVDHEFLPTMKIKLIEGRNFLNHPTADSSSIILNENAVQQLGLKKPYIGQQLEWDDVGKTHPVTVVGVVSDFHFTSLHEAIKPFGFIAEENNGSTFFIKLQSQNLAKSVAAIGQTWLKYNPGKPFDYSFQDEQVAKLYDADIKFKNLFSCVTILAIIIACLGLLGLSIFSAETRSKEIGIRKVLGASVTSLFGLMSKDFLLLIAIAFVAACPVAWWAINSWLQNYAYHIPISWRVFAVAGITAMLIALATVSYQAIKAAVANPVKSLRTE